MGAIRHNYAPVDAAILALQSGVDMIMLSEEHYDHDSAYLDKQLAMIAAVVAAVADGRIGRAELDRIVIRVVAFKLARLAGMALRQPYDEAAHRRTERLAAAAAVKVLADPAGNLPLAPARQLVVVQTSPPAAYANLDQRPRHRAEPGGAGLRVFRRPAGRRPGQRLAAGVRPRRRARLAARRAAAAGPAGVGGGGELSAAGRGLSGRARRPSCWPTWRRSSAASCWWSACATATRRRRRWPATCAPSAGRECSARAAARACLLGRGEVEHMGEGGGRVALG